MKPSDISRCGSFNNISNHKILNSFIFRRATSAIDATYYLHMISVMLAATSIAALFRHFYSAVVSCAGKKSKNEKIKKKLPKISDQ